MKDMFEELEAEVAQYAIDMKHDAIEWKNLLIVNDNLIAACLSQEVFSVATNSELNVVWFIEMHVANTTVEAHCLALKAELANLRNNNHDNQKELINHFSKLEGKDNVIRQLKKQLSQLQETRSDTDRTPKVQTTDSQITKLTSHVTHLQAQNGLFRAENDKIKQHYKELYDPIKITQYAIGTCPQGSQPQAKQLAYIPLNGKKQVTVATPSDNFPKASGSQPKSNPKPNRISPAKGVNKLPVEDQPRAKKSHVRTTNCVDSSSRRCSKHMMGDRSRLMNFVKKLIRIVRFGNDHFGAIMGYGDYVIGNSAISRVYYVEGLGHNLFSVRQFCDSDLEVVFRKHSCYVRDTDGVKLIKGSHGSNLFTI
nr:integrase, catalytic region, zinc finger, CCHC-type, peptidase aspartic, catalytic [Tanacetum cinerariifolium]